MYRNNLYISNMLVSVFTLVTICLLSSNAAHAGVYKCKNANGGMIYSDTPCASSNTTIKKPKTPAQIKKSIVKDDTDEQEKSQKKETPAPIKMGAATKACFDSVNTKEKYFNPETTKLLSSTKKWVSVKGIGARQMVVIETTSQNAAGMYIGKDQHKCLLQGNGTSINTNPYELL